MTVPTFWAMPPDTGWRDVLGVLGNHSAVTRLSLCRIGTTVWWSARVQTSGVAAPIKLADVPAGFRFAASYRDFFIPVYGGIGQPPATIATTTGGDSLMVHYTSTASSILDILFNYPIMRPSDLPWPTTLPGTAM